MKRHNENKAVVLLSGGIDSSTVLAMAKAGEYDLHALSFNYHQRHSRELESAKMIGSALEVKKHLFISFDMREIGGSALTTELAVPKKFGSDEQDAFQPAKHFIPVTYVPARNTIFLSFALAWAEVLGAGHIFIGANAVDYSGYPDCRPQYLRAYEEMANLATRISVEGNLKFRIHAPLLSMTKAEIIRKGLELGLDYSLTWSCYDPQRAPLKKGSGHGADLLPCGFCDSCLIRRKGFREAGVEDPLTACNTNDVSSLL
ncbi:MAG: 7-cyano-7-deazaguanine synthase QueC [Nitrospirae bacterium]|nr:7-cyano-7-deazaguanine synthase QueC [Nitrospirota bacterium]